MQIGISTQVELESVKKEALEQHLDFIVGQTSRFASDMRSQFAPVAALPGTTDSSSTAGAAATTVSSSNASTASGAVITGDTDPSVVPPTGVSDTLTTADAAAAAEKQEAADGDNEFVPDDAEADDESSMAQTDEPTDGAKEVASLANDAEMSMEELLAMYPGYGATSDGDEEESGDDENADSDVSESVSVPPPTSKSASGVASTTTNPNNTGQGRGGTTTPTEKTGEASAVTKGASTPATRHKRQHSPDTSSGEDAEGDTEGVVPLPTKRARSSRLAAKQNAAPATVVGSKPEETGAKEAEESTGERKRKRSDGDEGDDKENMNAGMRRVDRLALHTYCTEFIIMWIVLFY